MQKWGHRSVYYRVMPALTVYELQSYSLPESRDSLVRLQSLSAAFCTGRPSSIKRMLLPESIPGHCLHIQALRRSHRPRQVSVGGAEQLLLHRNRLLRMNKQGAKACLADGTFRDGGNGGSLSR